MVLQFPIMADYALFDLDGRTAFITHGHLFNLDNLPPHKPGDLLIHGHTHVLTVQEKDGVTYINPGSAALLQAAAADAEDGKQAAELAVYGIVVHAAGRSSQELHDL